MGGWVKWEKDKEQEPGFKRLVRKVRNGCVTAALQPDTAQALAVTLTMGALVKLWSYADTYIRSDDTLDMGPADIDELVAIPGFAEALPNDWLRVIDDEHVELPGYQTHNGIEAKKTALSQKRMSNKRSREQQHVRNGSVTLRAQVRNGRVTGASPDQTRPDQTKTETMCKSDDVAVVGSEGKAPATQPVGKPVALPNLVTHGQVEQLKGEYPKGTFRETEWLLAERLINWHASQGVTFDRMLGGVQRFAAQRRAKRNSSTEFTLGPVKFFDRELPQFDDPFHLPEATSAELPAPKLTWHPDEDEEATNARR